MRSEQMYDKLISNSPISFTREEAESWSEAALGWLEHLRQRGEVLEAGLESFYTRWIASFEAGWGGDAHLEEGLRRVALLRAVIPAATLEAMVLAAPVFPWQLGPASLSWEVVQRAALAQQGYPRGSHVPGIYGFRLFGREGARLLSRLLVEGKPCHAESVARALRLIGGPEAVPGLMAALSSSSKPTRAAAQQGLVQSEAVEIVLAALPAALVARRKDVRTLAAEALAMLPPSAAAHRLAQEALRGEQATEVREQLERVQAPPAEQKGAGVAAVAAQLEGRSPGAGLAWLDAEQARGSWEVVQHVAARARARRLALVPDNTVLGLPQQRALEWLIQQGEPYREEALLLGLELKDKWFRKRCADQLRAQVSPGLNAALIALLVQEAAPEEARMLAAELLADRGAGEGEAALGEVAAAGKVKKGAKLREAAAAALGRLQGVDV